jgi:hypothetical protein
MVLHPNHLALIQVSLLVIPELKEYCPAIHIRPPSLVKDRFQAGNQSFIFLKGFSFEKNNVLE